MLSQYLISYTKATDLLHYHQLRHQRLMARVFISCGVTAGMLLGILFLLGSGVPVPISFAIFEGWIFLYGCAMFCFANRHLSKVIRPAARDVYDHWEDIIEVSRR